MPDESSAEGCLSWTQRFRACWPEKIGITVILNLWFWGFYFYLSRHALAPIRSLPLTFLDSWADFQPYPWAWIYESNFLITGIIPWLMISRSQLRRYTVGFFLLSGVCFAVFALYPVASPRPATIADSTLVFITSVDGPLNAFPSLHAGSLVYTIALARRLQGGKFRGGVGAILMTWGALILFATLATKQHYAIDLLAGGLIGWIADRFAWRN